MQNKLQELTDKLYKEGLSRGKEEAEEILATAKLEAEKIIENARNKAAIIIENAEKDANDLRLKTESDLRLSSTQTIQTVKKEIENLIVVKMSDSGVDKNLQDSDFIREIISEIAKKFDASQAEDLEMILSDKIKDNLGSFVRDGLASTAGKSVEVKFSKNIKGGFVIAPKDGSYHISMTDESFRAIISEYLRPATKKILFGQ